MSTPQNENDLQQQAYHHVIFAEEEQSEGDFHELVKKLKTIRHYGIKKVIHLALGFFFLFAAYNTIQNYVTTLLPGCLGFTSLCVLYVSVCPSLLLAPGICARLGDKWTLVIGAMCYSIWIASLTRPDIPSLVMGASVVIGFGAAILWVAQGTYLTKQGDETNRGRLAGTFWGIFQLSGIVGNFGSYFVIYGSANDDDNDNNSTTKKVDGTELYMIGLIMSLVSAFVFACLSPAETFKNSKEILNNMMENDDESQPSIRDVQPDVSTPLVVDTDEATKHFAPLKSLRKEWKQLANRKHLLLLLSPLLFLTGYELAFVAGEFPLFFAKDKNQTSSVSLVFVFWAFAEVLGSYTIGNISEKIGKTYTLAFGVFIYIIALSITWQLDDDYLAVGTWKNISILAYIAGTFYGFADCTFNVIVLAKLGDLFPDNGSHGAFTIFQFLQNIGSALMFGIPVLFSNDHSESCSASNQSNMLRMVIIGSQGFVAMLSLFAFWCLP